MGNELNYYDVRPRIVRAGKEATVTIRPLFDHVRFKPNQAYHAILIPAEGSPGQMRWFEMPRCKFVIEHGEMRVACKFEDEQEYVLVIGQGQVDLVEFRLYALDEDLYARKPFKGDFHMHTYHSDGIESPAYVAAACRRIGMDFMAITDHHKYAPSQEAIQAFAGVETGLRIYPGEEVHAPGNPAHILNFGGSFSVNDLFKSEEFLSDVQKIEADLPDGLDRYPYAASVWCFNKIREGGGLAVFCHPYWFHRHRYDVPQALTTLILERQPFDALELIGGYHRFEVESNHLQVARYHEERARGKRIPIVGVSDSHGCETGSLFGWYYTIAFAPSDELGELIQSIKDLYSVAVEALPGEAPRAFGPFRLVRYAQYLMRELFPIHDHLCIEEGRLMLAHIAGDEQAATALKPLAGQVKDLYAQWWGKNRD
ncbi:MAG: hypothetical protein IH586_16055 [Anaerolineaceae bacterium]|nr:hypothetical protein [Anaerolineaceae bacterium]